MKANFIASFISSNTEFQNNLACDSNLLAFSKMLSFLSRELQSFYGLQNFISIINDESNLLSLTVDINEFLKELGCPYSVLLEGSIMDRFISVEPRQLLLRYLSTELAAAKIMSVQNTNGSFLFISSSIESELTGILKPVFNTLDIQNSSNMDTFSMFSKLFSAVNERLLTIPKYFIENSLLPSSLVLTDRQWGNVEHLIDILNSEYRLRGETHRKRLELTVNILSSKAKSQINEINDLTKSEIALNTNVNLIDLLAVRDFPVTLNNTVSKIVATNPGVDKLRKFIIGPLSDKGGRVEDFEREIEPSKPKKLKMN